MNQGAKSESVASGLGEGDMVAGNQNRGEGYGLQTGNSSGVEGFQKV